MVYFNRCRGMQTWLKQKRNRESRHQKPVPSAQQNRNKVAACIETWDNGGLTDGYIGGDADPHSG